MSVFIGSSRWVGNQGPRAFPRAQCNHIHPACHLQKKTIFSGILVSFTCRAGPTVTDSLCSTLDVRCSTFDVRISVGSRRERRTFNVELRTEETPASIHCNPNGIASNSPRLPSPDCWTLTSLWARRRKPCGVGRAPDRKWPAGCSRPPGIGQRSIRLIDRHLGGRRRARHGAGLHFRMRDCEC